MPPTIDSDHSGSSNDADAAMSSAPPFTPCGTSIMRGELVRSAEPGVPSIPFLELMLPDCAKELLRPRTITYEACDVRPHEHESIRVAVLNAFRRHFQWRNDEAPYVAFTTESDITYIDVTLATNEHWELAMEGLGWDGDGELSQIVIRTSGPYRTMGFVTSHEG